MPKEQARPQKQFLALESLPRHVSGATGMARVVALGYVRRNVVVPCAFAVAAACVAAATFSQPGLPPAPRAPQQTALQPADTKPAAAAEPAPPVPEVRPDENRGAEAHGSEASAGTDRARSSDPDLKSSSASPLRNIPDVDLSVLQPTAPAKEAAPALPAAANGNLSFNLPDDGVPSESEVASFFKAPEKETVKEAAPDLSPSVVLPAAVPAPAAKPEQKAATVSAPVVFRLVQGKGKKSGFWLGNRKDTNARRYFLVVTVERGDREAAEWTFRNVADGKEVTSGTLAVEVPEKVFRAMSDEYTKKGRIERDVLGTASTGSVSWNVDTVDGNMIAGWNSEKRK